MQGAIGEHVEILQLDGLYHAQLTRVMYTFKK